MNKKIDLGFTWVVIGMADIIAITGYWQLWVGKERIWVSMLLAVAVMLVLLLMNLATVKLFGETYLEENRLRSSCDAFKKDTTASFLDRH